MAWLWIYLGGMALWIFIVTAGVVATVPERDRGDYYSGTLVLAVVWPFGIAWVAAHLLGNQLRSTLKK